MNKCYIVGACKDSFQDFTYDESDMIIASDGGLNFIKGKYKIDLIVGDFDSLHYIPEDKNKVVLPCIKDITDTHRSIEEGIKKGYHDFEIIGCLGGRIEHSFATIQDCYHYSKEGYTFTLYSEKSELKIIHNSSFQKKADKGFISVFSLDEISNGVSISNLKYEVNNVSLSNDYPLGVSNEFIGKEGKIEVKDGTLLIIYTK